MFLSFTLSCREHCRVRREPGDLDQVMAWQPGPGRWVGIQETWTTVPLASPMVSEKLLHLSEATLRELGSVSVFFHDLWRTIAAAASYNVGVK